MLVDWQLIQLGEKGMIEPFERENVNPASVDLRLSDVIRRPYGMWNGYIHEPATVQWRMKEDLTIPHWRDPEQVEGFWLEPGDFVLCSTIETVRVPDDMVAFLWLKSSLGRIGLEHLHAGLGDPGFVGTWTMELANVSPWPIRLRAGQRVVQMTLERLDAVPDRSYQKTGRYNGQVLPEPSREVRG